MGKKKPPTGLTRNDPLNAGAIVEQLDEEKTEALKKASSGIFVGQYFAKVSASRYL